MALPIVHERTVPDVPTPAERQALLFVAAIAALGIGVRAWRAIDRPDADRTARGALAEQLAQVDSAVAVGGERRRPRARSTAARSVPLPRDEPTPSGPVDVDVATAVDLDRLPGIGPALAARIVEDRERNGPFGSLAALDRVKGIGPALAERLRPHVTFSLSPRPHDTEVPAASTTRRGRRP